MAHHFPAQLKHSLTACLLVITAGCNDQSAPPVNAPALDPAKIARLRDHYAITVDKTHEQSRNAAVLLRRAVTSFLADPSVPTRAGFQAAWLTAHQAFTATRVLLDDDLGSEVLFRIDSWPIEPGYLDSLPDYPASGIVNDLALSISAETLADQHGFSDSNEASLGFHPLEYYAFIRPVEDFVTGAGNPETVERRRLLLALMAEDLSASIDLLTRLDEAPPASPPVPDSGSRFFGQLLVHLHGAVQSSFQNASLIGDNDQGHCEYSQSSLVDLRVEVRVLQELFSGESSLVELLQDHNSAATTTVLDLVEQLAATLDQTPISEADRSRLPLLLLAISHQLEDFSAAFPP